MLQFCKKYNYKFLHVKKMFMIECLYKFVKGDYYQYFDE